MNAETLLIVVAVGDALAMSCVVLATVVQQGPACYYCGKDGRFPNDRVVPVSKGGTLSVPACPECNKAKANR